MPRILFAPEQLKQIVADTLIDVPKDHRVAVVGTFDRNGAAVVANFASVDGRWKLQAAYRHDWSGNDSIGAKVMFSQ